MTKTWQLRALCVYLTLGLPLAASCATETNTIEGDGLGAGATTSSGGKVSGISKAGTSSSAFGGTSTSSSGGSGAAGKMGTAGSVAAGGSTGGKAGVGAGGDSGGATMVPGDVLARAKVIVYYQTDEAAEMDQKIRMALFIKNQSPDPLPMSHVKIRYWFTAEASPQLHQYYVGPDVKLPNAVFVDAAANSYAQMTFGGGSIDMSGDINASQVQLQIDNNTNSLFNQKNDFSWNPADVDRTPNDKITLYLDDKLIWGCEPSGACFDDAAGGAGAGGAGSVADGAGGAGGIADGAGGAGSIAGGAGGAP